MKIYSIMHDNILDCFNFKGFYLKEEAEQWINDKVDKFLLDSKGGLVNFKYMWHTPSERSCSLDAIMYEIQKSVPDYTLNSCLYIEEIEVV